MSIDTEPLAIALSCLESFTSRSIPLDAQSVPLLVADPRAKIAARHRLHTAVSQVDDALITAMTLETKIQEILFDLRLSRSRALNLDAPASALPTEILQLIFEYVLANDSSPWSRIILSQVCSLWRVASLGFAKMWTCIVIENNHDIPLLAAFNKRTGPLPIELRVTNPDIWDHDMNAYIERFMSTRLTQLTLHTKEYGVEQAIATIDPLQLRTLSLHGNGQHFEIPHNISLIRRLEFSRLKLDAPVTGLLLPYLDFLHVDSTTLRSLSSILRDLDAPALRWLKIGGIKLDAAIEEADFPFDVNLPGLQWLELFRCQTEALRAILGHLTAPKLSFMHIELGTAHDFAHEISLDFRTIFSNAFAFRFTTLEKISMRIVSVFALPLFAALLNENEDEDIILPELKHLSIYLLDLPPGRHFAIAVTRRIQSLIRKRVPPSAPAEISRIESLKLARGFVMDSEDWFKENVPDFRIV